MVTDGRPDADTPREAPEPFQGEGGMQGGEGVPPLRAVRLHPTTPAAAAEIDLVLERFATDHEDWTGDAPDHDTLHGVRCLLLALALLPDHDHAYAACGVLSVLPPRTWAALPHDAEAVRRALWGSASGRQPAAAQRPNPRQVIRGLD